jgi:hypothetical protein
MPFLILLGVLVYLATRNEERDYRAIVAGEPDPMVVTDDEMKSLGSLWARRSARSAAGRLHGPIAAQLVGRLQAAQIEYAMVRSKADSLTDPALDTQRMKIRWIRAQLAGTPFMPAMLRPMAGPPPASSSGATGLHAPAQPVASPATAIHFVPSGGIAAWPTPDGSRLPAAVLPERLEVVVEARNGPWAEVRAANGWRGWVDGRLLVDRR